MIEEASSLGIIVWFLVWRKIFTLDYCNVGYEALPYDFFNLYFFCCFLLGAMGLDRSGLVKSKECYSWGARRELLHSEVICQSSELTNEVVL